MHRDSNNDASHPNILVKLSDFEGGEVWVEGEGSVEMLHPKGHVLKGRSLPWVDGKISLDARNCYHATLPWSGRRVVLVGYTIRDFSALSDCDKSTLVDRGFDCSKLFAPVPTDPSGSSPQVAQALSVDPNATAACATAAVSRFGFFG